jgi:hypothetical protein
MTTNDDEEEKAATLVVYIVTNSSDDDTKKGAGRPNAYWQRVREEQEREAHHDADSFGGSYRAVPPTPHGGAASVTAEDTIGTEELCWCGRPAGHHWPGKSVGAKHPKGSDMKQMSATIDRRDLRGYHQRVQDFLIQCINEDELKFRLAKNTVILFPPDGTAPVTVYARNGDRQIRQLQKWYLSHVYQESVEAPTAKAEDQGGAHTAKAVTPEQIEALANAKNDPQEHPAREDGDTPRSKDPEPPVAEEPPIAPPVEPEETDNGEWRPYIREKDGPSPNITTNGTWFRCELCKDTDHPLLTDSRRSIGGHNRVYHTNTSNLYSPEARAKAFETHRVNRMSTGVEEAIQILRNVIGQEPDTAKTEKLEKEIERLKGELASLKAEHEEVQAKLALVRESLSL